MAFTLKPLPYAFGALEPYIDALTMEIHHDRHNAAYVNNLNKALEGHPELESQSLEYLISHLDEVPESIRAAVRNNAGGDYNHTLFWTLMKPDGGGKPNGKLADAITKELGGFQIFQNTFNETAKKVFGSGWAWLCIDKEGQLHVTSTPNQDSPLMRGMHVIMGLDVWEHAYYLKYQNKRPDYINAWWHVLDWHQIEENYRMFVE